jgi:hypothetical protein
VSVVIDDTDINEDIHEGVVTDADASGPRRWMKFHPHEVTSSPARTGIIAPVTIPRNDHVKRFGICHMPRRW